MKEIESKILDMYIAEGMSIQDTVMSLGIMCGSGIASMDKTNKAMLIKSKEFNVLITVRINHE